MQAISVFSGHRQFQEERSISSLISPLPCLGAGTPAHPPAVPTAGGIQLIALTITTRLKPFSLFVFHIVLQPSFIWQLHRATFPIKQKLFCSFSAPLHFKRETPVEEALPKASSPRRQAFPKGPLAAPRSFRCRASLCISSHDAF